MENEKTIKEEPELKHDQGFTFDDDEDLERELNNTRRGRKGKTIKKFKEGLDQ